MAWQPPLAIAVDRQAVLNEIIRASDEQATWLLHPCLAPLVDNSSFDAWDAHVRLIAWVAAHSPQSGYNLGTITLPEDAWVWGHEGGLVAPKGKQTLGDIVAQMGIGMEVAVPDPWGDALPDRQVLEDLAANAWWEELPLAPDREMQLIHDLRAMFSAETSLKTVLPETARWMRNVTSVVIPLAQSGKATFRSGSVAGIPGLVAVEITHRELLTLEALIHESAHLYFHLAEASNPFIVEDHSDLYSSPLRTDPRPLRGIFLALHALIYMCGFYRSWHAKTGDERCLEALSHLRPLQDDAAETLHGASSALTAAGIAFLHTCSGLMEPAHSIDARGKSTDRYL